MAPPPAGTDKKSVRFVAISDTHGRHAQINNIPDGDVLIHCGDFTSKGKIEQVQSFADWFANLPHPRKLLIAGNHDMSLDKSFSRMGKDSYQNAKKIVENIHNTEYLMDSGTTVHGIKVYGSPWQPEFCNWGFNLKRGHQCDEKWRLIPSDTDVLITHGPPNGQGDRTLSGVHAGCVDLQRHIQHRIRPAVHFFGHIHEGAGITADEQTLYVNASTCDLRYRPTNLPIVIDMFPPGVTVGQDVGGKSRVSNRAVVCDKRHVLDVQNLPVHLRRCMCVPQQSSLVEVP